METITDLGTYTFKALLANSQRKFSDSNALSLIDGKPISYSQLAQKTQETARLLNALNLKKESKIAIYAGGCPNWGISYFAIVNYGRIAVPLLPDFSAVEVEAISNHCSLDALITSPQLYKKLQKSLNKLPKIIINIDDFSLISLPKELEKIPLDIETLSKNALDDVEVNESDTASIIYTSGTTGRSKGVELSHKNLVWNAVQCQTVHRVNKRDRCLSFLPLSHVYEFTIDFTMQILNGACVYYLGKPPVVSALLVAFQKVQPTIVCSVPLIMEKLYKNKVLPELQKTKLLRTLYKIRPIQIILHRIAGKKLKKLFGGYLVFFGIGGAKLDKKVERFLKDAKFPYAIGYGLTETSPLLAGSGPAITHPGTIGTILEGVDVKILNPDAKTGIGEVIAKGPNIMKGYYNDPKLTKECFTTEQDSCGEGLFKTGDLGTIEKIKGLQRLSLKGRCKTMILNSAGENIYPEDIEFVLNQHPLVQESLVVEDDNGLVALLNLDKEKIDIEVNKRVEKLPSVNELAALTAKAATEMTERFKRDLEYKREEIINEIQYFVNSKVNRNSHIGRIQVVDEFEKTATQKIKRYLYDLRTKIEKKLHP